MSAGPPPMPSSVRFAYARHAPNPRNWYSQEGYEGCLIAWDPIPDTVGVVAIRTAQNLPENCALDLMAGRYQQTAEQLLIKRPIDAIVDDQMHEHNRYLILVRTAAGAFVAPPFASKSSPPTPTAPPSVDSPFGPTPTDDPRAAIPPASTTQPCVLIPILTDFIGVTPITSPTSSATTSSSVPKPSAHSPATPPRSPNCARFWSEKALI